MTRVEALKFAEDLVSRLAPTTNARGYSYPADGVSPLDARVSAILCIAEFLIGDSPRGNEDGALNVLA